MARILVIEDEENLRFTIRRSLVRAGHTVSEAASLAPARELIRNHDFEFILTDVMLGGENGLDLVREVRADGFEGVIVVMTAFSTVEHAVAAIRDGADDYISKPLSLEELGMQVQKWIEHRRLARRVKLYERLEKTKSQTREVVGESARWKATVALAEKLAALPLPAPAPDASTPNGGGMLPTILLTGETGAGKGVLARYIHQRALDIAGTKSEADAPFVHVNCSALPPTLVEGELFGHEKGAFTDAREARPGLFEMADGGTIFLDEISEMPLELQAKLLLVVEHGTFRRVGGSKERRVRVRVIAASNQNLEERVAAGGFRRDLLYRLNAFVVKIPSLRERGNDAMAIAESSLDKLMRRYGRGEMHFSSDACAAIAAHAWPGNVRELINSVQRAVMLCEGDTIEPADLNLGQGPFEGHSQSLDPVPHSVNAAGRNGHSAGLAERAAPLVQGTLVFDFEHGPHRAEDVERELIMQALRHTHGNVSRAAKLIDMQRSSLRYRIERYGLETFIAEVSSR